MEENNERVHSHIPCSQSTNKSKITLPATCCMEYISICVSYSHQYYFFSCSLTLLKFLNQIASNTRKVFCTKYTKVHFWFASSVLQHMANEIHQTCTYNSSIIENFLKDGQKPRETMFKQNSHSKVIFNTTHFTIIVPFGQIN